MKEYEGDFVVHEKIELPDDGNFIDLAYEPTGETGNEASDIAMEPLTENTQNPIIPKPTIRQQADAAGSQTPRAIVIEE